jgi:hypothetical protein
MSAFTDWNCDRASSPDVLPCLNIYWIVPIIPPSMG